MGWFCKTCGNVKCTCKRETDVVQPAPVEGSQQTFLMVNQETGVAEVISAAEAEKNSKFNELLAATPAALVTVPLIVINVVVFLAMVVGGVGPIQPTPDSLLGWGANYGPLTTHGQWWRLITAMFAHAGIVHLAFNMYCLFRIGLFAERVFGNVRFAGLYFLAGIGGNLASLYWHPLQVCVGASGAIFGIFGAVLGLLISRPNAVPVNRAQGLTKDAVTFVAVNLLYGMMQPEVDMAAHVGGLVTGLVVGLILARAYLSPEGNLRANGGAASAAVWGIAMALLVGVAMLMPVVDDYRAEIKRFVSTERTTMALFNDSLTKLKKKDVTQTEFASIIQGKLLPQWNEERERIMKLRIPRREETITANVATLGKYMSLRAEGWGMMEKGILADDLAMVRAANRKQAEAQAVAQQLATNNKRGQR
jgi:rhomboid protease GluP